jgi:hypothetical protein
MRAGVECTAGESSKDEGPGWLKGTCWARSAVDVWDPSGRCLLERNFARLGVGSMSLLPEILFGGSGKDETADCDIAGTMCGLGLC